MPLAPEDKSDLILLELLNLHESSEPRMFDTIFRFLSRETSFYTANSMTAAREIILEKFEKYGADAFKVGKKKRRDLEKANKKKKKELETSPENNCGRLQNEKKKVGQAARAGRPEMQKLVDKEVKMLVQGSIQKKRNQNQSSGNEVELSHPQKSHTGSENKMRWLTSRFHGFPPREQHAAVAAENKIFSFGGINSRHLTDSRLAALDVFALDVSESELEWKLSPVISGTIPNHRTNHSAVAYQESIFIFGGQDTKMKKILNSTFRFNTKTLKWDEVKATGNIPEARYQHSAVLAGQKMIIFGGLGDRVTNDLQYLDLNSFHWSKIETKGIPPARLYDHSATVYEDHFMFIFGGREPDNYKYSSKLFCLDVNSKKWTQPTRKGRFPKARQGHSAFVHNGLIFIFGGVCYDSFLNSLWTYDPSLKVTTKLSLCKHCEQCVKL